MLDINNVEDQLDATITIYRYSNQLNMFRAKNCPKHVELIGISINCYCCIQLVFYIIYMHDAQSTNIKFVMEVFQCKKNRCSPSTMNAYVKWIYGSTHVRTEYLTLTRLVLLPEKNIVCAQLIVPNEYQPWQTKLLCLPAAGPQQGRVVSHFMN